MSSVPTQSIDDFRQKLRDTRPKCLLCGYVGHSLVGHLRDEHQQSPGQYKKQFGNDVALASPVSLELLAQVGKQPTDRALPLDVILPRILGDTTPAVLQDWKKAIGKVNVPAEEANFISKINPKFRFNENAQSYALAYALAKNCYVSGPTGCGKTDQIRQTLAQLGIPVRRANMHSDVTYGTFIGHMTADASGTHFKYGLLPLAMKAGTPVLLDEIDFTPPALSALLHPVLEKGGELFIPETMEWVKPEKGFMVFATGNTGGKGDSNGAYAGTEVIGTPFLDRFPLKLKEDYLPEKQEVELLIDVSNGKAERSFVEKLVKLARLVRDAFNSGSLTITLSTRKLLDVIELEPRLGTKKALDMALMNWLDKDDRPVVESFIKQVVYPY